MHFIWPHKTLKANWPTYKHRDIVLDKVFARTTHGENESNFYEQIDMIG